jgi:hypothetical protein
MKKIAHSTKKILQTTIHNLRLFFMDIPTITKFLDLAYISLLMTLQNKFSNRIVYNFSIKVKWIIYIQRPQSSILISIFNITQSTAFFFLPIFFFFTGTFIAFGFTFTNTQFKLCNTTCIKIKRHRHKRNTFSLN